MAELSQNNCPVVEMAEEAKAKGNAAFSSGNYQEAIRHFTEAISLSPSNHILYSNRSAAYAALSQFPQALNDAKKTVDLRPDWSKGYARLGSAYMGLNRIIDAFIAYLQGLEIDPDNQGFKSGSEDARARIRDPRNNGALVENFKLSLCEIGGMSKDEADAVNLKVVVEVVGEEEEEEEEEERERKAEAVKEKEAGDAAYLNKDFETAISCYSNAIELDDEDVSLLTNRATVYLQLGRYEDCIKDCDEAVERGRELESDFKMVARALTRKGTAQAKMAKTSKDFEPVIETFQKSLTEHHNPDTLRRLNDADKAKKELEQQEYLNQQIGDEEREKGNQLFEAIKHYNEAIKRNPKDHKGVGVGVGPPGSGGEIGEDKEKRERKAEAVKEKEAGNAPLG